MNKILNKRIIILTTILVSILFVGSIFSIAHAQEKQTEQSGIFKRVLNMYLPNEEQKDTYKWILQNLTPYGYFFPEQTDDGKTAEQRATEKQNEDDLAEIIRNSVTPPGEIDQRLEESIRRQSGGSSSKFDGTFVPLAGITGVTDAEAAKDPSKFFNGMFMFGISIAAFLAVLMIAIGGIQYMSTDAVYEKLEGRERIQYAVMGLLLVLFSWILLRQINPEILNFNFLDNTTSSYNNTNTGASSGVKSQKQTIQQSNPQPQQLNIDSVNQKLETDFQRWNNEQPDDTKKAKEFEAWNKEFGQNIFVSDEQKVIEFFKSKGY